MAQQNWKVTMANYRERNKKIIKFKAYYQV